MNETYTQTITDKQQIADLLIEQCLLRENIEVCNEKYKYDFYTFVLEDYQNPKQDGGDLLLPDVKATHESFVYLKQEHYLLLATPFFTEDNVPLDNDDPIRIRFYTGYFAYETMVRFELLYETPGKRLAMRTSFPEQLGVFHTRAQIRIPIVANSEAKLKIHTPVIGECLPYLKDISSNGLSFCVTYDQCERLAIDSEMSLSVDYPGETALKVDARVKHFTMTSETSPVSECKASSRQCGDRKAICGIKFDDLDPLEVSQLHKVMVLVQREYLLNEKKMITIFSLELERRVQAQTTLLREKDIQLMELDRTVGIVTLAAGIAHEINNPLSFINSAISFIKKSVIKMVETSRYWEGKPVPEQLLNEYEDFLDQINFKQIISSLDKKFDTIKRGIERITNIVGNLKSFSRLDREEVESIDINKSIEEALAIFRTSVDQNVEFAMEFQNLPPIECSVNDINQCLFHVINNAIDAVENNGIIKISTSHDKENNQIIVLIVDNGHGMETTVLKQVFNPFFTTKQVGEGTGIGLSITDRIVKRHGGKINIASKLTFGTTVTITLPVDCTIAPR